MKSNNSLNYSRSVQQVLQNHLPGDIRAISDRFVKIEQIALVEDINNQYYKDFILSDFYSTLTQWCQKYLKEYEGFKDELFLDEIINHKSLERTSDYKIKNTTHIENTLKAVFKKDKFDVGNINTLEEKRNTHHGSVFPFTYKCSNCQKLFYCEQPPSKNSDCCKKELVQIDVVLLHPSGNVHSIGHGFQVERKHIKCTHPSCDGFFKLKDTKEKLSDWKLVCNKNNTHTEPVSPNNYSLANAYSKSIFFIHHKEIINFSNNTAQWDEYIKGINHDDFEKNIDNNINKFSKENQSMYSLFKIAPNEELKKVLKNTLISSKEYKEIFPSNTNLINFNSLEYDSPIVNNFYLNKIKEKIDNENIYSLNNKTFGLEKISLVKNIEVVKYAYGFTRCADIPKKLGYNNVKLNFFKNKFTPNNQIYYTKENNNGLYFNVSFDKINQILQKNNLPIYKDKEELSKKYLKGYELNKEYNAQNLTFIYLHSLAHYLLKVISENFCGLNGSSLSEIIFPGELSFLIYKTGTGKDLGYLSSFIENQLSEFKEYIENKNNLICPAFDLCNEACPECLYINIHSCKYENDYLDRNLLYNNKCKSLNLNWNNYKENK